MPLNLWVYSITIIATIAISIWMIKHYQLNRYQVLIFVLLILFWSSINIIRAYRKSYAINPVESGGLSLGVIQGASIAAAYGLMSMIARFPVFLISDLFKSRKVMFSIALIGVASSSLWVIISPSYDSLFASSLALGLGASMLSLFNVVFAETFNPKQAMMSVSMLSIAPLLAEFLMSPFQYVATQNAIKDYPMMFKIALVLSVLGLIFLIFVKDNKQPERTMTMKTFKKLITSKQVIVFGLIGISISFIRFGLSGSNIITYAQNDFIGMHPFLIAYIDFIYSIAQLAAGMLAGLFFAKRIGTKNTLLLGVLCSIIFNIVLLFSQDSTLLFITYSISGFGYGLTYNSLIGLALEPYAPEEREMSMAIFQTFFAVGIYYGDKIYGLIMNIIPDSFTTFEMYQSVFFIILIITLGTFMVVWLSLKQEKKVNYQ